ncbi:MAG: hypothetical protein K1X64_03150 [Myxococcaceae bacterium]|nr:hypothetical protein [Myxococcaceae bacterium]
MRELGVLKLARPCPMKWNQLSGDDQVRFWQRSDGTVITRDPLGAAPVSFGLKSFRASLQASAPMRGAGSKCGA